MAGWQLVPPQVTTEYIPYWVWREALPYLLLGVEISDFEASILREIYPQIGDFIGRKVATVEALTGKAHSQRLAMAIVAVLESHAVSRAIDNLFEVHNSWH